MRMPKVTIVTITFNLIKAGREETFRQCVESVHNQNYSNVEHIIIDGASKDGSIALIKEYVDKGFVTCYSEPDTGIYDAMNKGIQKAKGKYIAFLNSDDFFHDADGIKKTVEVLEKEKADYSYAACKYLTSDGIYYGNLPPVIGSFFVRMPFSHQTMFTKTDVMRRLGGFDDTFRSSGDYDFVVRLCLSGAVGAEVPFNFVSYRLGGLSDSQQKQSENECIKSFEKNYKSFGVQTDWHQLFYHFKIPEVLFSKIKAKASKNLQTEMQQIWDEALDVEEGYKVICSYPMVTRSDQKGCLGRKEEKWYLFGKLPLLKIETVCRKSKKRYYLFNIPIFQIKNAESKFLIFCFGARLFKKVMNGNVIRYFVFRLPIVEVNKK